MIEIKNISKKYGQNQAVSDLSFVVEDGLVTGFLGPNGAGKSTTMNIMTGYIAPSSGTVLINGIDIQKEPENAKKQIGYLPEQPPVYMDMTVREYLTFVAELKNVPAKQREDQVDRVEALVELLEVEDRLIRNLSKGYRQRVGLAQAIVGFPPIIILDEPMVGLDPKQIIEIRDLIRKLRENHTVILSSHILSEISMVCDKIVIISGGKLVAYDTPEKLLEQNSKGTEIILTAKGEIPTISDFLLKFDDISFEMTPDKSNKDFCKVKITSNSDNELCERVFFAFADARIPIVEMHRNIHSLEDIFLELTENEDDSDEAASDSDDENDDENIVSDEESDDDISDNDDTASEENDN